jgi:hypothetical protein
MQREYRGFPSHGRQVELGKLLGEQFMLLAVVFQAGYTHEFLVVIARKWVWSGDRQT